MSHEPVERFEEEWKRWARRAPRTSPREAARQVVARLEKEEPRRTFTPRLRLAMAAAVAVATGLLLLPTAWPPAATSAGVVIETPPLNEGVVLIWLDSETPLYMTVRPPAPSEAGRRMSEGDPK